MRLTPLNKVSDKYADFGDDYLVGDDGHIYRRLKEGYYRSRKYDYRQVRNKFGTDKQHTLKINRAVAMAYCERPEGATDVDHINNDKSDNRAVNLQWLTHEENVRKRTADNERSVNGKDYSADQ